MIYSRGGLHLTEHFECCRLEAYADSGGVWTIGWGHTAGVKAGDACTQAQADCWLVADLISAVRCVNSYVKVTLTQNEFDSLVDFVFNIGSGNFCDSTLLRLLNAGDYHGAAQQFERWQFVAGHQCAGLLRRRVAEQALFEGAD